MEDRSKPPEGYWAGEAGDDETETSIAHMIGAGWEVSVSTPTRFATEPEAVAACWTHRDRIVRATLEKVRDAQCEHCLHGVKMAPDPWIHLHEVNVPGQARHARACTAVPIREMIDALEDK